MGLGCLLSPQEDMDGMDQGVEIALGTIRSSGNGLGPNLQVGVKVIKRRMMY